MSRKHFKRKKARKNKDTPLQIVQEIAQEKQIPRGETLRPSVNGGYTHSFNYYSFTVYPKENSNNLI